MARKPYQCSRCGLVGHNAATCGSEPRTPKESSQCSQCGLSGHNIRTCPQAPLAARSRCSLCGETDHNARTCGKLKKPVKKPTRQNQCQHCKGLGHNRATCTNAPDEFYLPPRAPTEQERALKREERWLKGVQDRYPGLIEQVGSVFDAHIAEQYGLSRERVRQIRSRLGRPRFEVLPPLLTDEEVLLLGAMPDAECGERLGLHPCVVQRERLRRGILSHGGSRRKERDALLASVHHLLGKVPDPEIVAMLGHRLTVPNVYRYRVRHGIQGKQQGTRWSPLDRSEITRLFKAGCSDTEIAQHLNANPGTVSLIRTRDLGLYHRGPPTCGKCGHQGHTQRTCEE